MANSKDTGKDYETAEMNEQDGAPSWKKVPDFRKAIKWGASALAIAAGAAVLMATGIAPAVPILAAAKGLAMWGAAAGLVGGALCRLEPLCGFKQGQSDPSGGRVVLGSFATLALVGAGIGIAMHCPPVGSPLIWALANMGLFHGVATLCALGAGAAAAVSGIASGFIAKAAKDEFNGMKKTYEQKQHTAKLMAREESHQPTWRGMQAILKTGFDNAGKSPAIVSAHASAAQPAKHRRFGG